ncbi:hypothetical protein JXI42_08990 [bacterium]|nr:hypothetical protein [bacterium]
MVKINRSFYIRLICLCIILCSFSIIRAEGPQRLNYQGKLLQNGSAVDGSKAVGYKIFKGSSTAWQQAPHDVAVSNGLFSDELNLSTGFIGGNDIKTLFEDYGTSPCSLEVWVGDPGADWGRCIALSPKEVLLAMPHALSVADSIVTDNKIDWAGEGAIPSAGEVSANDIPIQDAGGYFTTDNVEAALQVAGAPKQLTDLTDVNTSIPTAGNILMADGSDWESVSQTDITCLGTIGVGTWQGSTIDEFYIDGEMTRDTEWDTEAELEAHLIDVGDVYTSNDGDLAEDDLSNDPINSLQNVNAAPSSVGEVLKWNGSQWIAGNDEGGIAPGTVNSATVRWNGSAWAENTTVLSQSNRLDVGTPGAEAMLYVGNPAGRYLRLRATDYGGAAQNIVSSNDLYILPDGGLILQPGSNIEVKTDGGTQYVFFDGTNQRVGIGTGSPAAKLDVQNGGIKTLWSGEEVTINGETGNPSIELRDTDGSGLTPFIDFSNDGSVDFDARLILTGNDYLAIEGANVGIGTTTPDDLLDVAGWMDASSGVQVNDKTAVQWGYAASVSAGYWYRIASNSGNRTNAVFTLRDYISGGGHSTLTFQVGISYDYEPGMSFTMLNHTYYSTPTFTEVRIWESTYTYDPMYIEVYVRRAGSVDFNITDNMQSSGWTPVNWSAGSTPTGTGSYTAREFTVNRLFVVGDYDDRFTINHGGNVGIGTDNPDDKLDVVGNSQVSGYLRVGNPSSPYFSGVTNWDRIWYDDISANIWRYAHYCGAVVGEWWYSSSGYYYYDNQGGRNREQLRTPWVYIPPFYNNIRIIADIWTDLESGFDGVFAEYTINGINWTKITSWSAVGYNSSVSGSNTDCSSSDYQTAWTGSTSGLATSNAIATTGGWYRFSYTGMEDYSVSTGEWRIYNMEVQAQPNYTISGFETGGIYASGHIFAHSNSHIGDIAEYFPVTGQAEPGDVIAIDPDNKETYVVSNKANNPLVIGIHSTEPSLSVNNPSDGIPVALSGRVPVKISIENGEIHIGDYLTTSSIKGYAMKAEGSCFVIGKALEAFNGADSDYGKILCFVEPGWYNPSSYSRTSGGSYDIRRNQERVVVYDESVTADSRVFVSLLGDPGARTWISEKGEGMFVLELNSPAGQDVQFDYFVDNAKMKTAGDMLSNDLNDNKAQNNRSDANGLQVSYEEEGVNNVPPQPPDPNKAWIWTEEKGFEEIKIATNPEFDMGKSN